MGWGGEGRTVLKTGGLNESFLTGISPLGSPNTGAQTYTLQARYWTKLLWRVLTSLRDTSRDSDFGFIGFLKKRSCWFTL